MHPTINLCKHKLGLWYPVNGVYPWTVNEFAELLFYRSRLARESYVHCHSWWSVGHVHFFFFFFAWELSYECGPLPRYHLPSRAVLYLYIDLELCNLEGLRSEITTDSAVIISKTRPFNGTMQRLTWHRLCSVDPSRISVLCPASQHGTRSSIIGFHHFLFVVGNTKRKKRKNEVGRRSRNSERSTARSSMTSGTPERDKELPRFSELVRSRV